MIRSIEHIGIAVRSIEEARGFYEALGLAVDSIEEVPRGGVRVALIPCGETRIELLEPTSPDSPIAKFLEKRGPGIHHVCLASDAVERRRRARCAAAGIELLRPEPTTRRRRRARPVRAPAESAGGVLVELSKGDTNERRAAAPWCVIHLANPTEKFWGMLDASRRASA